MIEFFRVTSNGDIPILLDVREHIANALHQGAILLPGSRLGLF
jgi:hypothetical protein